MAFPFLKAALRAHGDRRQRRLAASRQLAEGRLVFEQLEPRVLLSADALTVALSGDAAHPMAHDVVVEAVSQHLPTTDSVTVQMVQVVDLSANNQVLASGALGTISNIQITSGTGNTSLTVDTASFGAAKAPAITFTGGNGNNTLAVTGNNETDWAITGNNAGSVTGSAAISFTGVSNLSGGADNTNTFTVTPGGGLAGTLSGTPDGSVGGTDTLVFQNYNATNAAFTAAGPHAGTVNLDGSVFTYAGLTPVVFSGNATNVTITGSTSTDDLTLADTSVAGQMEVASLNNSLESITFARPTASLTVDFGSGNNDSLEIGTLQLGGAGLTVAGGNGPDSVSIDPGAYVSTRDTTGNALNAPSLGNSGDMNLSAETITVNTGAQLYANANSG
ncbi:MAG TPA: LEPR-XLL domain-containing protein, partial [Acetobacteraceae bacterium]|nr:LEPR-XLL domain-containing protein [Acetobacteraceae bacterium]